MKGMASTTPNHRLSTQTAWFDFQPATAWMSILVLIAFTTVLVLVGAGSILNAAFPTGAFVVGFVLYYRAPLLYVGFSWWLWFLTPLVRRLADYRSSFTDPSPILLAPSLVALLTLITVWQHLPRLSRRGALPFVLAGAGIGYAFCIGLLSREPVPATLSFLGWILPITFGFHLFAHWRYYPEYRRNLERVFVWAVLVMGAYGVYQYFVAPEWDRFWLISTKLTTMGNPEPMGIRVWSTLNSVEPFGSVMAGGLIVLFHSKTPLQLPAAIVGYLSFLLSIMRSAWLGWFVGLLSLIALLQGRAQVRMHVTLLIMVLCVVPLAVIEPFAGLLNSRLSTFSDLENDGSANARRWFYATQLDSALANITGDGTGSPPIDSSLFSMLLDLGWVGGLPYLIGLLLLLLKVFQSNVTRIDPFIRVIQAVVLTVLARFLVNTVLVGVSGVLLWGFLGLGLAAIQYYRNPLTSSDVNRSEESVL
ncbi:O-antigen ligase domain-containing protein [Phormidesmis sp. 146-35]